MLELHPTRALSVTSRVRTLYEPRTSHDTDRAGRDWVVAADESSLGIRIGIEFASEEPPLVVRAHVERRVIDRGPSRAGSSGLATYLSARLDPAPWITIGGFLALHSVTDADVAPSIAVSDLPGRTTSQRLYGEGRVLGLSARLRATEGMTLSASYVEVRRIDVDTLGSGLDALEGPLQRGVSVQIDIRLRAR